MTKKTSLNEGHVTITLDGAERELIPSVEAITKLCQIYGGMREVGAKLYQYDINAFVAVVRYGIQATPEETKKLPELVYRAGIENLIRPVTDYIAVLLQGGRVASEDPNGDEPEGNA